MRRTRVRGRARATPTRGYRSKLEADYADELERERLAGEIVSWEYERLKLRLADGTWYTPDFWVTALSGEFEIRETKGHKFQAGMIKLKVAASLYPCFTFILVERAGRAFQQTEIDV